VAQPVPDARPTISTHVLDTASGRPAAGVHVILSKVGDDGRPIRMTQALTDADGRIRDLLERPLSPGVYRLEFSLARAVALPAPGRAGGPDPGAGIDRDPDAPEGPRLFERVSLDLRVTDVSRSYHVPLLLAPYSVTSYRGS